MGYTTMRDGANHNAEPGGSEFKLGGYMRIPYKDRPNKGICHVISYHC